MVEEDKAKSLLEVSRFSPDAFRGGRGIAFLILETVGLIAFNVLAWTPQPRRVATTQEHYDILASLSVTTGTALAIGAVCLMSITFISIWSHVSPPPRDARNHAVLIGVVAGLGFASFLAGTVLGSPHP